MMSSTCVVGALACQRDSYLRTIDAKVVVCDKAEKLNTKGIKNQKPKATNGDSDDSQQDLWLIEFSDSVLFPEGNTPP